MLFGVPSSAGLLMDVRGVLVFAHAALFRAYGHAAAGAGGGGVGFRPAIVAPHADIGAQLASEQKAGRLRITPVLIVVTAEGLGEGEYERSAATQERLGQMLFQSNRGNLFSGLSY